MDDLAESPRREAQKKLLSVPSLLWSTPKNGCQHMPFWANISSKAPWCIPEVHISPSHINNSSLASESHGRPSLQTHRVWVRSQNASWLTSTSSYPYPTLDACSYTAPKPDAISESRTLFLWLHLCPQHSWPRLHSNSYQSSPPGFQITQSPHPRWMEQFTGSPWGAAGWPGLGQQARVQLMLPGAAGTAVEKERCGLLWVQKDQTLVMIRDGKCALAKAGLGQNITLTSSFHYVFVAISKYNCLFPGREEVLKPQHFHFPPAISVYFSEN